MRALMAVLVDGTDEGRRQAEKELLALAEKLDRLDEKQRGQRVLISDLSGALGDMLALDDWHDDAIANPQTIANARAVHERATQSLDDAQGPVITRRFDEADLTAEWRRTAKWQVVFKLKGLDYCREPQPRDWTIEQVEAWVTEQCRIHKLDGAEIQFW
ncbi:hypothetical protein [Paraburkholderia fungorum]|uniref:hypothetical protein n=1 Tax=Paraburkholderia fungorum TaxID=134537 RepID=UPI0038BA7313